MEAKEQAIQSGKQEDKVIGEAKKTQQKQARIKSPKPNLVKTSPSKQNQLQTPKSIKTQEKSRSRSPQNQIKSSHLNTSSNKKNDGKSAMSNNEKENIKVITAEKKQTGGKNNTRNKGKNVTTGSLAQTKTATSPKQRKNVHFLNQDIDCKPLEADQNSKNKINKTSSTDPVHIRSQNSKAGGGSNSEADRNKSNIASDSHNGPDLAKPEGMQSESLQNALNLPSVANMQSIKSLRQLSPTFKPKRDANNDHSSTGVNKQKPTSNINKLTPASAISNRPQSVEGKLDVENKENEHQNNDVSYTSQKAPHLPKLANLHPALHPPPETELLPHETHPGHVTSIENVTHPSHYRNLFVGVARSLALLQLTHNAHQDQQAHDERKQSSSNNSSFELNMTQKPTLQSLAQKYRRQNPTKFQKHLEEEKKTFYLNSLDYEDPFLSAYYKEQEDQYKKEIQEKEMAKNERPKIFVEVTFNLPRQNNNEVTDSEDCNNNSKLKDEKKGEKIKISPFNTTKNDKSYKTLDADGYSIFDCEETSDKDVKDDERGSKTELLIRVKKGMHLNNWLQKMCAEHCQLSYAKCYLYAKPGALQKPKKQRSSNCFIAQSGQTYWDHVFILRGFSFEELKKLYVVINIKGKHRERFQDIEKDNIHVTPQELLVQKRDQIVHAVKGKNISLGTIVLGGEDAKIFPIAALMYRDTTEMEYAAWQNACEHPGETYKIERHLVAHDDLPSSLSLLPSHSPTAKQKHRWHNILTRGRKASSSSVSS